MSSGYPPARVAALGVGIVSVLTACVTLVLLWHLDVLALPIRIQLAVDTAATIVLGAVTVVIAWRAGDRPPNVAVALAIGFIAASTALGMLRLAAGWPASIRHDYAAMLLFALGAGFFIRASQLFPSKLSANDLEASVTAWGRIRPFRSFLGFLLHPQAAWVFAAGVTVAVYMSRNVYVRECLRLLIVSIGVVYLHVRYRSGAAEERRKVLWFLEGAVATLMIGIAAVGISAILGDGASPSVRSLLGIGLTLANSVALSTCILAAVFYAGAISPALVVRRTVVYGATAGVMLFAFAIIESFVVELLMSALPVNDRLASAILGAACGLAVGPVRTWLEGLLRSLLPRVAAEERAAMPEPIGRSNSRFA